jgi:DNA-binding transcriptional ArsR family regulator
MSVNDLLPETAPSTVDRTSQTVDIVNDGDVLDALASDTARQIILTLKDSSGTASDIASALNVSLQNVCYHLDRLQSAGLVEVIGTRYSSKGKEMEIYGFVTNPIVIQFGEGKRQSETDGESGPNDTAEMSDQVKIKK